MMHSILSDVMHIYELKETIPITIYKYDVYKTLSELQCAEVKFVDICSWIGITAFTAGPVFK
jgi:hypothetical protein